MIKTIDYKETLRKNSVIYVDVRSPAEYQEATIPKAVNLPILKNEERKIVGQVYHQESPMSARIKAVEFVSPKIPKLIKEIKKLKKRYNYVVLFCSRGNLRSESLAQFCQLAGLPVYQLKGGYKSYRHYILDQLDNYILNPALLVIHGNTGVGKTDLLYLLQNQGLPIIDLEKLANHRGSVFGGIGLDKPTNQKLFDSLLWEKLEQLQNREVIAVEAESKRIGMSNLPEFFLQSMEKGHHILIKSSLEARINRIYSEYADNYQKNKSQFINSAQESIKSVKKHLIREMGKYKYHRLLENCNNGEIKEVVKILLTNYYDPLYKQAQKKINNYDLILESDNLSQIASQILNYIKNL